MPSWTELTQQLESQRTDIARKEWLISKIDEYLRKISNLREERNVIFYGSAFLQKPMANQMSLQINHEDINGFMPAIHGMNCSKGLTLIMHTPGGVTNSTETIVSYLRSKFEYIEVIIPTFAMSAGTMISLSSNKIIMGRQSQLGPIDPQMAGNGHIISAIAIIDQFERAKEEISKDVNQAHLWAPILASLGPALLQEAQNATTYSEIIVANWLEKFMFKDFAEPHKKASEVAKHFSRGSDSEKENKKISHGRRIDREEAKSQELIVEDLENSQEFQEAVLTAYHLLTILFEKSPALKIIASHEGKKWIKNA